MNGIRATLPITDYQKQILESVTAHPVTIITAETGAGKSTQVPQYFMTDPRFNDYRIIHTQPRRLAARTVSARVAEEMDVMFGTQVGYRTAHEHRDSPDTRCLFVTDGLALVREILHGDHRPKILILDEVHEWNLNMEVLIAWVKVQLAQGADYKVVIMSATMESDKLATFFNGANVIQVPGRQFAVEDRPPSFDLITDVTDLLNEGHNVLVFQPGKAEISRTIQDLEDRHLRAVVLPLHGELPPHEQAR